MLTDSKRPNNYTKCWYLRWSWLGMHKMLPYIAFLLQGICQIAVGIGEVGLQFNSTAVGVNSQVNEALLVVDTGQVSMDNRMVGAKTQGS